MGWTSVDSFSNPRLTSGESAALETSRYVGRINKHSVLSFRRLQKVGHGSFPLSRDIVSVVIIDLW